MSVLMKCSGNLVAPAHLLSVAEMDEDRAQDGPAQRKDRSVWTDHLVVPRIALPGDSMAVLRVFLSSPPSSSV